jgi:hypothetical protein
MWALRTFASATMVRMVAAVPKGFVMTSEEARDVDEFIDSLFPVSAAGFIFDAFISNADVNDYHLEALSVPTLIAHTKMTNSPLTMRVSARQSASPAPGLSASSREGT